MTELWIPLRGISKQLRATQHAQRVEPGTCARREGRDAAGACHLPRFQKEPENRGFFFFFFPLTYKVTKKHKDTGKIEDPAGFL